MPSPTLYSAPRQPHEWWRDTLPTVPATADWESMIQCVERIDDGVSLAVLDGRAAQPLTLPAPGSPVFGMQVWVEGDATMTVDGGVPLTASDGMAVLFNHDRPVGALSRISADTRVRMVDIRYTPQALRELRADLDPVALLRRRFAPRASVPASGALVAAFEAPASLLVLAHGILHGAPPLPAARRLWHRAKALEMLAAFVQLLAAPPPLCRPSPQDLLRIREARQLLDKRYTEEWPPARIAREVGLSEKRLQRGMRELVGKSAHAYLCDVRLDRALDMLRAGFSVTRAAGDVGFSSLSHFSKIFKARYGCSPRDWMQAG